MLLIRFKEYFKIWPSFFVYTPTVSSKASHKQHGQLWAKNYGQISKYLRFIKVSHSFFSRLCCWYVSKNISKSGPAFSFILRQLVPKHPINTTVNSGQKITVRFQNICDLLWPWARKHRGGSTNAWSVGNDTRISDRMGIQERSTSTIPPLGFP